MSAQIQAENSEHRYFTMMLNMAEDELDPFQYRLLAHYVRWSDKLRRESIRDTASACKMSVAKVRAVRRELTTLGYIEVHAATEDQRRQGVAGFVTVKDRWLENVNRYAQGVSDLDQPPVSKIDHNRRTREKKNNAAPKNGASQRAKNANEDLHHALVKEFGLDVLTLKGKADTPYWITAADLKTQNVKAEEIADLYTYVQRKAVEGKWKSWTVMALSKYVPDWRAAHKTVPVSTDGNSIFDMEPIW